MTRLSLDAYAPRRNIPLTTVLHHTQLADDRVDHPRDVVKVGEERELVVVDVDPRERRIALSIKALSGPPSNYREFMREDPNARTTLGDKLAGKLAGIKPGA